MILPPSRLGAAISGFRASLAAASGSSRRRCRVILRRTRRSASRLFAEVLHERAPGRRDCRARRHWIARTASRPAFDAEDVDPGATAVRTTDRSAQRSPRAAKRQPGEEDDAEQRVLFGLVHGPVSRSESSDQSAPPLTNCLHQLESRSACTVGDVFLLARIRPSSMTPILSPTENAHARLWVTTSPVDAELIANAADQLGESGRR